MNSTRIDPGAEEVPQPMTEQEAGKIAVTIVQYIYQKRKVELDPICGPDNFKETSARWNISNVDVIDFFISVILPVAIRAHTRHYKNLFEFQIPGFNPNDTVKGRIAIKIVVDEYCKMPANDFFNRLKKMSKECGVTFNQLKEFYTKFILPEYAKLLEKLELK